MRRCEQERVAESPPFECKKTDHGEGGASVVYNLVVFPNAYKQSSEQSHCHPFVLRLYRVPPQWRYYRIYSTKLLTTLVRVLIYRVQEFVSFLVRIVWYGT